MTSKTAYRNRITSGLPIYTLRLVREGSFPFQIREKVEGDGEIARFLGPYFADKAREEFVVVLLDTGGTIIGMHVGSVGGLAGTVVEPRTVFVPALLANAAAVVVAHNHPSGQIKPSAEDRVITRKLVDAGRLLGIPVFDHLIVAEGRWYSFAANGLI